jgi:fatty acid desaturase
MRLLPVILTEQAMRLNSPGVTLPAAPEIEWPTIGLVVLCYGLWLCAGVFIYAMVPLVSFILMVLAIALHSSLQHEIMHGHPTRNRFVNEALVFLPIGLFYPYRRYRATHMQHHHDERLTDPYDDPESYYRAEGDWEMLSPVMKRLLAWNNTLGGRMLLGPGLMVAGFYRSEFRLIRQDRTIRKAWIWHGLGLAIVLAIVGLVFSMPVWLYGLAAYAGLSLIAVRTYCEHQWSDAPEGRTIIVEKSLLSWLFLNNNLHIVHHKLPTVAWYQLPRLYAAARMEWQEMNGGYVFPNYLAILKAYAFRAKEPNVHPVWHRKDRAMPVDPVMDHEQDDQPQKARA